MYVCFAKIDMPLRMYVHMQVYLLICMNYIHAHELLESFGHRHDGEVGQITQAHEGTQCNVWCMDWHPLGHVLATGSNDRTTKAPPSSSSRAITQLFNAHVPVVLDPQSPWS